MELPYRIKTVVHVNLHQLVCYFDKTYPDIFNSKYSYGKWYDAILDYLDIDSTNEGCFYMLYRPNEYTNKNYWVSQYIGRLFHDYFPDQEMIYLDD